MRLGGSQMIPVNVRIIAAANKDMQAAVKDGSFRQDLLYRIDVLRLELPPLRKREQDLLELTECYINLERQKTGCILKDLDEHAQRWILQQPWEGNVRELRNFCERLCVLCENGTATMEDISIASGTNATSAPISATKTSCAKSDEAEEIISALREHNGSRKETAAALHIDTSTLWRKMKKYDITS